MRCCSVGRCQKVNLCVVEYSVCEVIGELRVYLMGVWDRGVAGCWCVLVFCGISGFREIG